MAHWHEADDVPVSYHHVVVIFTLPVAPLNGICPTSERETGPDYVFGFENEGFVIPGYSFEYLYISLQLPKHVAGVFGELMAMSVTAESTLP